MNKIITLLAVSTLVGSTAAHAQHHRRSSYNQPTVQVGAKAGLSLAVLDGVINQETEYKAGPHVGVFLRWKPAVHLAIQPELTYSAQGAKNTFPAGPVELKSKTNLSYLNLPILAKVYLGKMVNVQVGPQVGMLLGARQKGQVSYTTTGGGGTYQEADEDVKALYKGDFGLCGGLGVDLPSGLLLAARLNYGLSDITKDENAKKIRDYYGIGGLHNRVFEFSLGYAFGGR